MKKFLKSSRPFFIVLLIANVLLISSAISQPYYSRASGAWNSNTTWSLTSGGVAVGTGIFPVAGDIVYIENGFSVSIPAGVSVACAILNLSNATNAGNGTLTFAAATSALTVSGNITLGTAGTTKTGNITMAGGTLTCNGSITIGSNAACSLTQTGSTVSIAGTATILQSTLANITNAWNVNTGTATVTGLFTLDGTDVTTSKRSNIVITTGTLNANGGVQINGTTAATKNITMTGASSVLNVGGNGISGTATNATFTAGSGTSVVNFNATGNQSIPNYSYFRLTTSSSGIKTLAGITTVSNALTVSAGTELALTTFSLSTPSTTVLECGAATGSSITGTGTLTLGGNVSVNNLNAGTSGATISVPVSLNGDRTFTVADDGSAAIDLTVSGIIGTASNNDLIKAGAGTMALAAANIYTGTTTVNAGTLQYAVNNALSTGAVTVSGGTFDIATFTDAVGTVTLTSGAIAGSTGVLTGTSYAVQAGTISAILAGAVALTKTTTGIVVLSGLNTYTGATSVSAGTLSINTIANAGTASSIGTGSVTPAISIGATGILQYTGTGHTSNRAISISSDGPTIEAAGSGTLTLTGGVTGSGDDLNLIGSGNGIMGSVIATGGGALVNKSGTGTWQLTAANTYTGTTNVNGGTLQYGINNSLSTGGITVNGGTLDIGAFSDAVGTVTLTNGTIAGTSGVLSGSSFEMENGTVSAILGGTGALTKSTTGTVTLSGLNTYTGVTSISAGILIANTITDGGVAGSLGAATTAAANLVLGTATLSYSGSTPASTNRNFTITGSRIITIELLTDNLTISGASTNSTGGLTKTGDGTLILSGTNLYTGLTTVADRILRYGVNNALSSGAVTIDGGILDIVAFSDVVGVVTLVDGEINGTSGTLTGTSFAMQDGIVTANLAGTGVLTKSTTGSVTLSGVNTYTGATNINAGVLNVSTIGDGGVAGNLGAASTTASNLTLAGGTLRYTGLSASTNRNFVLTGATTSTIEVTTNTLTMSGASTSTSGALTKAGSGTLILSGNNLHTGVTNVAAGILRLGAAERLLNTGTLVVDGTFDMNGFSETIGALSGGGTVTSSAAGTIIFTVGNATSTSFTGAITNGSATLFSLTKLGTGTLALSGNNTYSGTTTITAGSILLEATDVLPNTSVLLGGGTLNTGTSGGFTETIGDLTVSANSTIALGTGVHTLTIANSAANTWAATTLTITGWTGLGGSGGTGSAGKIQVGVGGLNNSQLNKINFTGFIPGAIITASGELVPNSGVYYSQGSVAPNTLANWNSLRAGGGLTPANFTSGNTFVIQDTHSMQTSGAWTVSGTGSKILIESGGTLISTNAITVAAATTFQIDNGGVYKHRNTGAWASTIFTGIEIFAAQSTVEINLTSTTLPTNTSYGNLIVNLTSDPGGTMTFAGALTTIQDSLSIQNTQNRELRLVANSPASYTLNITGNLNVSGATTSFVLVSGTSNPVINVGGNVSIRGGTMNMSQSSGFSTLNVTGNYAHTGGTITETGSVRGEIIFNGSNQLYTSGGSLANTINFTVNNGSILQFGTGAVPAIIPAGSTGTFQNFGTLGITSAAGISLTGATGNVQVAGTRTYNGSGSYIYNGSGSQFSGNGLTAATNLEINNAAGIILSNNAAVSNIITLTAGNIDCGANTLSVTNTATGAIVRTTAYIIGNLRLSIAGGVNSYAFPVGTASAYSPVTLNFAAGTGAGMLTVRATAPIASPAPGNPPTGPGISPLKYVNRYWQLGNSTMATADYSATFTYIDPADLVGAVNTNNLVIAKNTGGTWSNPGVSSSISPSVTSVTGLTSFGDFYLGEACVAPTGLTYTSNTVTYCVNATIATNSPTFSGSAATSYSVTPALPAGLNLNTSTGEITGTPTVAIAAANYTVTVNNACGSTTRVLNITVEANSIALTSAVGTDGQTLCVNTAITNITYAIGGSATAALITAGALPAGVTGSFATGVFTISGTATVSGNFSYTVTTSGGSCAQPSLSGTITVNANSTISLSSVAGTDAQTVCNNAAITNITYAVGGGATGASITAGGLPAGVTGSYSLGVFTISGIPTATGIVNYTITTTGPCVNASLNGTITVNANSTISLSSVAGTDAQTVCNNAAITNITYAAGGGATGATISAGALPAGVTGSYSLGVFTISGTPTATGIFNYTITTTGPCVNASLSGTITVNANSTISLSSVAGTDAQTVCNNAAITDITYSAGGGATGATISAGALPAGVTGSYSIGVFTISGTPTASGIFNYTISTTGPCVNASLSGTITVNPNSTLTLTSGPGSNNQAACNGAAIGTITFAIGGGATGAVATGLPAGVTGIFSAGVLTINGTPAGPGTYNYTVTTTGGGCAQASLGGTIISNAAPTLNIVKNNVSVCIANNGSIAVTPVGGVAPYNYVWTGIIGSGNPATTPYPNPGNVSSISGLTIGFYNVTVTDQNGCPITVSNIHVEYAYSIYITNSGSISSACGNTGSIILYGNAGVQPYSYSLDNVNYFTGPGANIFTGLAAGNYTAYVKDASGCVSTKSITVSAAAPIVVNPYVVGASSCVADGSIQIFRTGGIPPYSYSLTSPTGPWVTNTNTFTGLAAGNYTAYVKDGAGCVGSQAVTVAQGAGLSINANKTNTSTCVNDGTIQLNVTGGVAPYTYSKDNGANYQPGNSFTALAAGNYPMKVKDSKGCTGNINVNIALNGIGVTAFATPASNCASNGSLQLFRTGGVGPYTYSIDGNTYQSGTTFPSATFPTLLPGTYDGFVKDSKGCIGILSGIVIGPSCPGPIAGSARSSKPEISIDNKLEAIAYPNPSNTEFALSIRSNVQEPVSILVRDLLGRTVYQVVGTVGKQYRFGNSFSAGIYILQIMQGKNTQSVRLIKE